MLEWSIVQSRHAFGSMLVNLNTSKGSVVFFEVFFEGFFSDSCLFADSTDEGVLLFG